MWKYKVFGYFNYDKIGIGIKNIIIISKQTSTKVD